MDFVILLLPLLLLIAGLVMFGRGLRGRRVDDHPLCRRCGFDLTGKPEASEVCAECGADLRAPKAIVHGHRERRAVLAAVGAVLVLVVIVPAAILISSQAKDFDVYRVIPTWLIVREAKQTVPVGVRVFAWAELKRRAALPGGLS